MTVYNYFPDHVTETELINYAARHDDLYVRKLSDIVEEARRAVNGEGYFHYSVDECIQKQHDEISSLTWQLEEAEKLKLEAEQDREEFSNRVASLRYDLDRNFQYSQIECLKAQLHDMQTELFYERNKVRSLQKDFDRLEADHKYLQEKHNTWTIIATK